MAALYHWPGTGNLSLSARAAFATKDRVRTTPIPSSAPHVPPTSDIKNPGFRRRGMRRPATTRWLGAATAPPGGARPPKRSHATKTAPPSPRHTHVGASVASAVPSSSLAIRSSVARSASFRASQRRSLYRATYSSRSSASSSLSSPRLRQTAPDGGGGARTSSNDATQSTTRSDSAGLGRMCVILAVRARDPRGSGCGGWVTVYRTILTCFSNTVFSPGERVA